MRNVGGNDRSRSTNDRSREINDRSRSINDRSRGINDRSWVTNDRSPVIMIPREINDRFHGKDRPVRKERGTVSMQVKLAFCSIEKEE